MIGVEVYIWRTVGNSEEDVTVPEDANVENSPMVERKH